MAGFDRVAASYDQDFTQTETGRLQRDQVWQYLEKQLPSSGLNILELNCGTGEDALYLAGKNNKLTLTDISEVMLELTKKKLTSAGFFEKDNRVSVLKYDMRQMDDPFQAGSFDLVF